MKRIFLTAVCLLGLVLGARADVIVDEITAELLDYVNTGGTYVSFADRQMVSTAVYAGTLARHFSYESMQFKVAQNSGLVTTASGGKLKKITVEIDFHSGSANEGENNSFKIYGRTEAEGPYTKAADLYSSSTRGTQISSTAVKRTSGGSNTTVSVDVSGNNYAYVGFCGSGAQAIYVKSIELEWEGQPATTMVQAPVITPAGGKFPLKAEVTIMCPTEGATIVYTLDGSDPADGGITYSAPFTIEQSCIVKACATKQDMRSSRTVSAQFTITAGLEVTDHLTADKMQYVNNFMTFAYFKGYRDASPAAYAGNMAVNRDYHDMQVRTSDDSGLITTASGGTVKSITVTWGKRMLTLSAGDASKRYRELYVYGRTFEQGPYTASSDLVDETLRGDFIGTIIYDGRNGNPKMTVTLTPDKEYAYIGFRGKEMAMYMESIDIDWDVPMLSCEAPVYTTTPGEYAEAMTATLECATPGAMIFYTLDGSDPLDPTVMPQIYTEPIAIDVTTVVRACAEAPKRLRSAEVIGEYVIGTPGENNFTPAAPIISHPSGEYADEFDITIVSPTFDADIYYTLDGTEPDAATGTLYTGPVHIDATVTVKAIAVVGDAVSPVATATYTRNVKALNGIDAITGAAAGAARYYNLQGCPVERPARGSMVIEVVDGKARKVKF